MLLCSCRGVSDRTIKATVAAGAESPDEVARLCGAGSVCGGCVPAIEELLRNCDNSTGGVLRRRRNPAA